jgi:hypothetical protein
MDATATAPAEPQRFDSLTAMQDRHAELVKEIGADPLASGSPEQIAAFVRRGAATGAILDAKDDRAAAQGLINFWVARLAAAVRTADRKGTEKPGATVAAPRFDDTLLAEFNPDTVRATAASADAWLRTLPESDQWLPRRVMLRLVRLRPAGTTFDPVPTVKAALYDLDTPERVNAVVDRLAAAGVVRVTKAESPELDRISVRYSELTSSWGTYASWLAERRRFRDAVVAWDQAGRPADALAKGAPLEEGRSYFDRDSLEREFIEQSRRREWHENERNRILKWVFGGLALAALIGWGMAGISYYWVKEEARLTAAANTALEGEQQTLRKKHELTNLRLLVRGVGELAAARPGSEQEIARARWEALVNQFEQDPHAAALREQLNLGELGKCAMCQDGRRLSAADIARIRRLRNPILENREVYPTLAAMRQISFAMVSLSATQTVAGLKAGKRYSDIEPYAREFWTQYWGEMLLIEGHGVEAAMVAFGRALGDLWAEAEKPEGPLVHDLKSKLSAVEGRYGEKGKQLTQGLNDLRLNAASFARLEDKAKELKIPERDRKNLQEDLNQIRTQVINRPAKNDPLVTALAEKLEPLLNALNTELGHEIPEYAEAVPR